MELEESHTGESAPGDKITRLRNRTITIVINQVACHFIQDSLLWIGYHGSTMTIIG